MANPRVLTSFTKATDDSLKVTAGSVLNGLTGNPVFPNPTVSLTTLETAITDFSDALVEQEQGGSMATAAKKNKRETLVRILRRLASYVEDNCDGNLAALLSSGFAAASTSRVQAHLAAPFILRLLNGHTGQLLVKLRKPIANAKCYELRYVVVAPLGAGQGADGTPGPWQSGDLCSNSRALALNGLTPGTTYNVQIRAIGGSTGQSDWSPLTSHMSL